MSASFGLARHPDKPIPLLGLISYSRKERAALEMAQGKHTAASHKPIPVAWQWLP